MPVVGRHEEDAAVLRIVIAMRASRVPRQRRRPIGAFPRFELRDLPVARARKGERRGLLHEVARADAAFARLRLFDDGVNRARIKQDQPDRLQVHAADAARALLCFEHVRMHRTRPGDGRKLRGRGHGEDDGGHDDRESPRVHWIIASVAKARDPRTWRRRSVGVS